MKQLYFNWIVSQVFLYEKSYTHVIKIDTSYVRENIHASLNRFIYCCERSDDITVNSERAAHSK